MPSSFQILLWWCTPINALIGCFSILSLIYKYLVVGHYLTIMLTTDTISGKEVFFTPAVCTITKCIDIRTI